MAGLSRSSVFKPLNDINERVKAVVKCPLSRDGPDLWLDVPSLKAREAGRTVSVAAIIAVTVNTDDGWK